MLRKIASPFLLIGLILSGCAQTAAAEIQNDVPPIQPIESEMPAETFVPAETIAATEAATGVTPAQMEDPLASLKGNIVKDDEWYLLLLGFVNTPNAAAYYQFPESFQFPHLRLKEDFRILDANGAQVDFSEVDPGDLNLYAENPLGEGIIDPRAIRLLSKDIQGPLTLELVNLIKGVNLTNQPNLSFAIQFQADFPLGKNQWDINHTVDLIPEHPFTIQYFDATVLNDYNQGAFSGPQNTFFPGAWYLDAAGFEGISFGQIVPDERQAELPMGGGGYEQACAELFANCVMSDAGLLKTDDNVYQLQITAYRLMVHGPWQFQFDLP